MYRDYSIGRNPFKNDIVVYDKTISNNHARFQILDKGKAQIRDLNTKNNTKLNDQLLPSNIFTDVYEGDKIFLGTANFYLIYKVKSSIYKEFENYDAGTRFKVEKNKHLNKK